jgi:hypothetical protein
MLLSEEYIGLYPNIYLYYFHPVPSVAIRNMKVPKTWKQTYKLENVELII